MPNFPCLIFCLFHGIHVQEVKKNSCVDRRMSYFHLNEQGEKGGDAFKKKIEDFIYICLALSITTLSED